MRGRDITIGKQNATARQLVKIRRLDILPEVVEAKIGIALVVADYDDDVGAGFRRLTQSRRNQPDDEEKTRDARRQDGTTKNQISIVYRHLVK